MQIGDIVRVTLEGRVSHIYMDGSIQIQTFDERGLFLSKYEVPGTSVIVGGV